MICVNNKVIDHYRAGMSLNDSIRAEFADEIADQIKKDESLKELTPLNMVMRDAKISKYSTMGDLMDTAMYTTTGANSNEWLFPAFIESTVREALYADDIIQYLCDTTIGVDSNIIKSPSLNLMTAENKKAISMMRVGEGADLPTAKIKMGESAISLWKHGRAIEMTYEAIRRMKIPLFQRQMTAILQDIAHQNLNAAVDVLYNGDGNNNKATKISTLANLEALTPEALVGVLIDYYMENHYVADTLTMSKDKFKKLVGMTYDPKLAAGASMQLTFNTPQIGKQNVTILCADVPKVNSGKDSIILSNRAMSLIRYEENGSNIQENQNFARNQTQLLTVSENSGYAINTVGSNRYIEFTA